VGIPQPMGSILCLCIDLVTELAPATSLAYELPENNIMKMPPRNVKTDRLTSLPLLIYSYFIAGTIITAGCFLAYFQVFSFYGVSAADLFANNNKYFPSVDDESYFHTTDGSGRSFSPREQKHILAVVQGSWYLMIVVGQACNIWLCRTCATSIFEHGVFTNFKTNYGVALALSLGCFVIYTPGVRDFTQAQNPLSLVILYATLFSGSLLWINGEGRKYFTRNYPDHWLNAYLAW
jgi:magnesium-transporting ATPase (P-type)